MTIKVFKMARKSVVFLLPLLFSVACENDLNSIDAGFIDNKNFETKEEYYDVSVSTEDIDKVETFVLDATKSETVKSNLSTSSITSKEELKDNLKKQLLHQEVF